MLEEKSTYREDDIQALEGRVHVRMRPHLYFEKVFAEKSLDRLPLEVACHAFDEFFDGNCSKLTILLAKDHFSISYDAGMPLKLEKNDTITFAELIMTKIAACKNYKKHLSVGDEFCELGITVINAASEWCSLLTCSNRQKGEFLFKEGKTEKRLITESNETENYTKITVKPDATIFPNLEINPKTLQEKINSITEKLKGLDIQLEVQN